MELYSERSSTPKWNAQRNLAGRTHYVDDGTLKWHHSRILDTYIIDNGLLFALIESCPDAENKRGFRYVIFDVFGTVILRRNLEAMFNSHKKAEDSMWLELNALDAKQITLDAVDRVERCHADEMNRLRATVKRIREKAA